MDRFPFSARNWIFVFTALLVASAAFASTPFDQKPLASGIVSEVNAEARMIAINGGQIVLDASQAQIRGPLPNENRPFSAIKPGMQIAVVFAPGAFSPGQALPVTIVQILQQPFGTMTGKVEAVDLANRMFKVNGQFIQVTDNTRFGSNVASLDAHNLAELPIGRDVTVFFDGNPDALVAHEVYIIAPIPDEMVAFSGIVKQIRGNTWTLINSRFESFKTTSRTAIEGFPPPRVGDQVNVFGRIDDGVVTAEFISVGRTQCPNFQPNPTIPVRGILIARDSGSVTVDNGTAVIKAFLNNSTLFDGGDAVVGDNVEVRAERMGDNFIAKMVTRFDHSITFTFLGTLKSISTTNPPVWTIESSTVNTPDDQAYVQTRTVIIASTANIAGNPQVGDKVISLVDRAPDGTLTARSITKDPRQ